MTDTEIQTFATAAGGTAKRVNWCGNPPHAPYEYGWVIRIPGYTTPEQRKALRDAGFRFYGGKWGRKDPDID